MTVTMFVEIEHVSIWGTKQDHLLTFATNTFAYIAHMKSNLSPSIQLHLSVRIRLAPVRPSPVLGPLTMVLALDIQMKGCWAGV